MLSATCHCDAIRVRVGVNIGNFDSADIGDVRVRLLDVADTGKSLFWEDMP